MPNSWEFEKIEGGITKSGADEIVGKGNIYMCVITSIQ